MCQIVFANFGWSNAMVFSTSQRLLPVDMLASLNRESDKSTLCPFRSGRWFSSWRLRYSLSMVNTIQIMPK